MENNIKDTISKEIINWADDISLTKGYDEDIEKLVKRLQDHISDIFDKLEQQKAELIDFIRYMYYNVGLDEDEEKKFDTILQKHNTGE